MEEQVGTAAAARWASISRPISTYWVKTSTELALGQDHVEEFVERGELARPALQRTRLVQELRRVVADLLQLR